MVTMGGGNDREKTEGELLGAGNVLTFDPGSGYMSVFGLQRLIDCLLFCMYVIL